jgi:mono/diheme cytochrome c family protein
MYRLSFLAIVLGMALVGCEKTWDSSDRSAGKEIYDKHCIQCHGPEGDVRAAENYSAETPDLRRITERMAQGRMPRVMLRELIDGRRLVQAHGNRTMPVWGELLDSEDDGTADEKIDALLDYIESIQIK